MANEGKTKRHMIDIGPVVSAHVSAAAEHLFIDRSALVRLAVREFIDVRFPDGLEVSTLENAEPIAV